jgi:hypothetical protein
LAVVVEGTATATIIKVCEENGVKYVAATKFSSVPDTKVELISL